MANLFRILHTIMYQNSPSFIEDMTKTFWLTFFWDTVYIRLIAAVMSRYGAVFIRLQHCSKYVFRSRDLHQITHATSKCHARDRVEVGRVE